MKRKLRKRSWLILAALVLVIAGVVAANFYPMLLMTPLDTGAIPGTDIIAVNSRINDLYLLPCEEGYIAIDAGSDAAAVQSALTELGIEPGEIIAVLLTHSDYDHVAALPLFPKAQLYMNVDERQMVDGRTKRNVGGSNSLPTGISAADFTLLTAGQELELGGRSISCLKAPGHTPGSMAYLVDGAYLFSGDMCRISDNKIMLHPFTMDKEQAQASLAIIDQLRESEALVFTAHYGYYAAKDLH